MRAPPLVEDAPPETMILFGDNKPTWERLLPQMTPVCVYQRDGFMFCRWEMPIEIAIMAGLDKPVCANPDCGCTDMLEYEQGFIVDTNWSQTGWWFDDI